MKKVMGLWDIVLMNVVAIIGLRWIPIAAGYGAASIFLWVLAVVLFFMPLAFVSTELATAWPDEGGLYVWVREAYGDRLAFVIAWLYWINTFFYCPALLTFLAVTFTYMIGIHLAHDRLFITLLVIFFLWAITLVNLRNLRYVRWLSNVSSVLGILVPGVIIIMLGFLSVFWWKMPIPTDYSFSQWIPNLGHGSNIAFLSALMFSMAGIELTPILAGETKDPQKTFPRAILISAFLIIGIYILSTMALTFIIHPAKIGAATGIMDAIVLISHKLHLSFLVYLMASMLVFSSFGGISVWVTGSTKMFFESIKTGVFPEWFTRLNRHEMPQNAMLIQAGVITCVMLLTAILPTINAIYVALVLMSTLTYFIPYLFMMGSVLRLRKKYPNQPRPYRIPGGKVGLYLFTIFGFLSVFLAIVLAAIPFSGLETVGDVVLYESELLGGGALFIWFGFWIYMRYERKHCVQK